jgi:hypothetical protein
MSAPPFSIAIGGRRATIRHRAWSTFHKCYRACLRSKTSAWHLLEPKPRDPGRWPVLAKRYLELADRYSERLLPAA